MKKLYAALVSGLFCLPFLQAQNAEKKTMSLAEVRDEIRKTHQAMRAEMEKMGFDKAAPMLDTAFYYFDFEGLGEDDRIAVPEIDERSLLEIFDEMESQLEQIEGIDTSAMNDLMEFFWRKMRDLPAESAEPSDPLPADASKKKRKTSSL